MSEFYHPNPEELHYDPEKEALKALLDGVASIDAFIDPKEAQELAAVISYYIPGTDTVGTPIYAEGLFDSKYPGELVARGRAGEILKKAIDLYVYLICRAADIDPDSIERPIVEALKYRGEGMEFHDDNYSPNTKLATGAEYIGVLNGVLTLSGAAVYTYIDPATGIEEDVPVSAGTLVVSRSGDYEGLSQVRHKVSGPQLIDGRRERIVLLIGLSGLWGDS